MNSSLQATLTKVLQNVSTGEPTVQTRTGLSSHPGTHFYTYSTDFLNSSSHGNATYVLEGEDENDSTAWLSIRFVIIACVMIGIVLLSLASYSVHRKWCSNDSQRLKYHKATLML